MQQKRAHGLLRGKTKNLNNRNSMYKNNIFSGYNDDLDLNGTMPSMSVLTSVKKTKKRNTDPINKAPFSRSYSTIDPPKSALTNKIRQYNAKRNNKGKQKHNSNHNNNNNSNGLNYSINSNSSADTMSLSMPANFPNKTHSVPTKIGNGNELKSNNNHDDIEPLGQFNARLTEHLNSNTNDNSRRTSSPVMLKNGQEYVIRGDPEQMHYKDKKINKRQPPTQVKVMFCIIVSIIIEMIILLYYLETTFNTNKYKYK